MNSSAPGDADHIDQCPGSDIRGSRQQDLSRMSESKDIRIYPDAALDLTFAMTIRGSTEANVNSGSLAARLVDGPQLDRKSVV